MILHSVKLENFKKHALLEVNFNEGVNLIVGSNYSGKSTIVQACMLGLLGNSAVEGQTSDLIMTGAETFKVSLKLSNGFTIVRSPKSSTVYDPEDKAVVRSHTAVNGWVEELLNVKKKTFKNVFCSEQGSPQALLQMEGAELQRFIEVCLGVDDMDLTVKKANGEERATEAKIEANEEYLLKPEVFDDLNASIPARELRISNSKSDLFAHDKIIRETTEARNTLTAEIKAQERVNTDSEKYLFQLDTMTKQLEELGTPDQIRSTDDLDSKIVDMDAAITAATTQQAEIVFLEKQCKTATRNLGIYEEAIAFFKDNFPEELSCKEEFDKAERLQAELNSTASSITRLTKAINSNSCGECGRPFDDSVDVEEMKVDLKKLKDLRSMQRDTVELAEADYHAALSLQTKYRSAQDNAKEAEGYMSQVLANQADFTSQLEALGTVPIGFEDGSFQQTKDNALRERRKILENNAAAREATRYILSAREGIKNLVKPKGVPASVKNMEIRLAGVLQQLGSETTQKAVTEQVISSQTYEVGREKTLIFNHKEVAEKIVLLRLTQQDYQSISATITSIRKKVIDEGFTQIMAIASEFVSTCTGGDISEVFLSETGIRYEENGTNFGKANASGAQKSLIGLGMKLGIAQIVSSPFGCMILDEISADMDEEVSLACLTTMGDYNEQAIVVSHSAMDVADNMIEL